MTYAAKLARRLARLRVPSPLALALLLPLFGIACSNDGPTEAVGAPIGGGPGTGRLVLTPQTVTLQSSQQVLFRASEGAAVGSANLKAIQWSATGGSITGDGLYTAPEEPGSYTVTARLGGDSSSAAVTVTRTPAAAGGGSYPNRPSGLTPVIHNTFAGATLSASGDLGAWAGPVYGGENFAIVRDGSSPARVPAVAQIRWPAGLAAGNAPTRFDGWDKLSDDFSQNTRYRKIYVSMWVKIPSPDFENQNTGTKLWYLAHGNTRQQNADFLMLSGTYAGTSVMPAMKIAMYISPADEAVFPGSQEYGQNVDTRPLLTCGSWHQVEVYMDQGTVGRADGTLQVWVDGTKVTDYTQRVKFLDPAYDFTQGFYNLQWTPVWGGTGGRKSRADYIRLAELYAAGGT